MDTELKQYLDKRFDQVDKQFDKVYTKIDDSTESLGRIIAVTVAEPMEQHFVELKDYDLVRTDVNVLKHDVQKIKTALQLK